MERYRRLVESSPDGILIVQDERITFVNPAAGPLFAVRDPTQLLGRPFVELFAADCREDVREQCLPPAERRSLRSVDRPPRSVDARTVDPDGTVRELQLTHVAIDVDGAAALQVIARDVTEQRAAERALRDSEERLALAVDGAQEGVWDWNLETNAVVYSARWKQMLGYSEEEIEPHLSAWERLAHPDDRSRADRANESVAQGERAFYEAEFRLRHKLGHYVHVLSRGFPVRRQPGGAVVRIVGTHLDLTDRKRAEASLRESEERLALAFAGAQEGVWDWNLETGAVVYSSRWKAMLGYADDEIEPHIGAWERLLHSEDIERARRVSEDVARGASTYEGEFRLRHKDGHYVQVLSRGYPVRRDPGGPIVRIVGTHFDLTERKRAEAERTRTEILTRLVFAQEDERRRIAREMHDQFGEQLTALALAIRRLREMCGNDEMRAQVDSIDAIAQRLDRDVDDLIWELRPTALDDLGLRAALANYIHAWSTRVGIRADLHTTGLLDDRLPSEVETALYRIAQEALTNVAKHARAKSVDVILERRSDAVLLIVEDDGIGFDPATAGGDGQGFGVLGMHERAGLVGATLEIESSQGQGTTVIVRITGNATRNAANHE